LDCRLSKDKQVVVIHDDNLQRLCHQTGWVSEMTWDELKSIRILPAPIVSTPAEDRYVPSKVISSLKSKVDCVCLLEDVLRLARDARDKPVKVFVEIKSTSFDWREAKELAIAVAKVIQQEKATDYACVISFAPLVLYHLRVFAPDIECCMLYSDDFFRCTVYSGAEKYSWWLPYVYKPLDVLTRYSCQYFFPEFIGCTMVGPDVNLLSIADIKSFRQRNLEIYAWVVNTPADAAWCYRHGISYGTDSMFPNLLIESSENIPPALTNAMAKAIEDKLKSLPYGYDSFAYDYDGHIAKAISDSKHLSGTPPPFNFTSIRATNAAAAQRLAAVTTATVAAATSAVAATVAATSAAASVAMTAAVAAATAPGTPTIPVLRQLGRRLEDSDAE